MHSRVNWWNVWGLVSGLIGSGSIFYYALYSQWIIKTGQIAIEYPPISPWWFKIGIGLVMVSFGLQVVGCFCGSRQ